jgi:hypothetical protein
MLDAEHVAAMIDQQTTAAGAAGATVGVCALGRYAVSLGPTSRFAFPFPESPDRRCLNMAT